MNRRILSHVHKETWFTWILVLNFQLYSDLVGKTTQCKWSWFCLTLVCYDIKFESSSVFHEFDRLVLRDMQVLLTKLQNQANFVLCICNIRHSQVKKLPVAFSYFEAQKQSKHIIIQLIITYTTIHLKQTNCRNLNWSIWVD